MLARKYILHSYTLPTVKTNMPYQNGSIKYQNNFPFHILLEINGKYMEIRPK